MTATVETAPAVQPWRAVRTGVGQPCPLCKCSQCPKDECGYCGRLTCRYCTVRWFREETGREELVVWCRECWHRGIDDGCRPAAAT